MERLTETEATPTQAAGAAPETDPRVDLPRLLAACRARHENAVRDRIAAQVHGGRANGMDESFITCAVLTGDTVSFTARHDPTIDMVERPGPETGWRSQSDIRNALGQRVSLELVSSVASHDANAAQGGTNQAAAGTGGHRALALLSIGEADRRLAETETDFDTTRAIAYAPTDANGAIDLLLLSAILDDLESALVEARVRRVRRIHGFPAKNPDGPCQVAIRVWPAEEHLFRTTLVRSVLRQPATGAVLAVCEALYRS